MMFIRNKKGIRAKERLVCNIINYMEEDDKDHCCAHQFAAITAYVGELYVGNFHCYLHVLRGLGACLYIRQRFTVLSMITFWGSESSSSARGRAMLWRRRL